MIAHRLLLMYIIIVHKTAKWNMKISRKALTHVKQLKNILLCLWDFIISYLLFIFPLLAENSLAWYLNLFQVLSYISLRPVILTNITWIPFSRITKVSQCFVILIIFRYMTSFYLNRCSNLVFLHFSCLQSCFERQS